MSCYLKWPDTSSLYGLRDRTILELIYSTGMRRSEVIKLETRDIQFDQGILLVRQAKGNKDRLIPIGSRP
ncbi:MAG: tyrosine-type recombinase/integrase [Opitutales bacterium]|nr:tyrosine-type recombinase/integrase [Opitutales bacterium]